MEVVPKTLTQRLYKDTYISVLPGISVVEPLCWVHRVAGPQPSCPSYSLLLVLLASELVASSCISLPRSCISDFVRCHCLQSMRLVQLFTHFTAEAQLPGSLALQSSVCCG